VSRFAHGHDHRYAFEIPYDDGDGMRDYDMWRLQEDSFNELIMGHDPVPANSVSE